MPLPVVYHSKNRGESIGEPRAKKASSDPLFRFISKDFCAKETENKTGSPPAPAVMIQRTYELYAHEDYEFNSQNGKK